MKRQFLLQVETGLGTKFVVEEGKWLELVRSQLQFAIGAATNGPVPAVSLLQLVDASEVDIAKTALVKQ
jgi:hypothetical protein